MMHRDDTTDSVPLASSSLREAQRRGNQEKAGTVTTTAVLVLEDGTSFVGQSCGANGEAAGEICFNTAMIGYPEIISDPAYAGSILVMTYPQVGNYGIAREDLESDRIALRGLVVRDICYTPSNFRSDLSLPDYLTEQGIVALMGIDTRALFKHLQSLDSMWAIISTEESDPAKLQARLSELKYSAEKNLVAEVSTRELWDSGSWQSTDPDDLIASHTGWHVPYPTPRFRVAAIDCGITRSELRHLARAACFFTLLPWDSRADEIMSYKPDGVFVSGGPGHPSAPQATLGALRELLGRLPIFGLGLGHQLIALAAGGKVERMKAPHIGNNHPVLEIASHTVSATMQHHRYSVDFNSLGSCEAELPGCVRNEDFGLIQLTHTHSDDKTVEGLRFLDIPVISAQFHPTVLPDATGPHPLYAEFVKLMKIGEKGKAEVPFKACDDSVLRTEADHA